MVSVGNTWCARPDVKRNYATWTRLVLRVSALLLFLQVCPTASWARPDPAASTTQLSVKAGGAAASSVAAGTVVTLTASVTAHSAPVTTGQITFCDNAAGSCSFLHVLGKAQLTSSGLAVFSYVPGIGSHSYSAVFAPTTFVQTSTSSAATLTVTGTPVYATTTAIAQAGAAGNYTLTATVTGTGAFAAPIAGSISFLDTTLSNAMLGTASLGTNSAAPVFTTASSPSVSNEPFPIVHADFNGDGKVDLAVASYEGGDVTVLLGNGDGTFTAAPSLSASGSFPYAIVAADFNGDGKVDLAIPNQIADTVTVLLGNGDGTFTAAADVALSSESEEITVGDFNGDGKADLAVSLYAANEIQILLGNGDGTFTVGSTSPTATEPYAIVTADFNDDGIADLAVSGNYEGGMTILLGNGDGTFTAAATPTGIVDAFGMAVGDFNGDGKADLALTGLESSSLSILLGNGDGTFTTSTVATPKPGYGIVVSDFNQDGKADLAISAYTGETIPMTILLGNGDGTFAVSSATATVGAESLQSATADFNGDGVPDIAATNLASNSVSILLTQVTQSAVATLTHVSPIGSGLHAVKASYAGGTNYAASSSATTSLTAAKAATTLELSASTDAAGFGSAVVLTATLTPSDPEGLTSNGGVVSFYNGATIIGTGTLTSGVATLSVSSLPLGANALKADYAGNVNLAASTSAVATVTVSKAATTLALSASPSSAALGAKVVLTATLNPFASGGITSNGGVITFYNGVTSIGTGTLTSGVATLSLTSLPMGSNTLTAKYAGTTDLAASTSTATTVSVLGNTGLDVDLSASSATMSGDGAAVYTLTITPMGSSQFTSEVKFAVTGAPELSNVSFSPQTIAAGSGAQAVTMTVDVPRVATLHERGAGLGRVLAPVFLGMLLLPFSGRLRRSGKTLGSMVCLFVLAIAGLSALAGITGCGGSSAKTYNMTVTATSGSLSKSANVTLIIK